MATNDRDRRDDRRRDDRDDRGGGAKAEPWNLYEIQERKPRPGHADDGETKSDFRECGIAFEMKKGTGFNIETYFALPAGARLAILPRRGKDDRGR